MSTILPDDLEPVAPVPISISDDEADVNMEGDGEQVPASSVAATSSAAAAAATTAAESSDSDAPTLGRNNKRRSSRSVGISAADYTLSSSESDDDDAGEYDADEYAAATGAYSARDLEFQRECESAIACGLPSACMHAIEIDALPEFSASYPMLYVDLRNTICRQWQKALTSYLTFDDYVRRADLDDSKLIACARRVFDFLNVHGFINCGLLPVTQGTPQSRPKEQQRPPAHCNGAAAAHTPAVRRRLSDIHSSPLQRQNSNGSASVKAESSATVKEENATLTVAIMKTDTCVKDEPMGSPLTPATPLPSPNPAADATATLSFPATTATASIIALPSSPAAAAAASAAPLQPAPLSSHRRILIIGAGASGLAAARQLQSFGHTVTVLEGRDRVGGRVNTIRDKFSAPVDLGASIMTGLYGSPLNVLCKQHLQREFHVGFSTATAVAKSTVEAPAKPFADLMHYIQHGCVIYDEHGVLVGSEIDTKAEAVFNKLLEGEFALKRNSGLECEAPADGKLTKEEMDKIRLPNPNEVYNMDVETGLEVVRKALNIRLTPQEQKLFDWHAANLEYGCATPLKALSMVYWDQDDAMAWEGDHALIKPGFGSFVDQLAIDVDIRFNQHVQSISYAPASDDAASLPSSSPSSLPSASSDTAAVAPSSASPVTVSVLDKTTNVASDFPADLVLCTASLGVLKAGHLDFRPALPSWKSQAISSLGFGLLNKLILEFDTAFWKSKNDSDMFGYVTPGPRESRGKFYIFWNLERSTGRPILAALCAGEAAHAMEHDTEESLVTECMKALRAIHSEQKVPDPIHSHQTRWMQDEYARGSYSFLAAGNNGKEYDLLAKPVGTTLYFAGEACNRDYPATVPGAYLSGLRAAGQMQAQIFGWNRTNPGADVLRELSRQKKSAVLSKPDLVASALKQQAVRELYQQGASSGEDALQLKVAEILARQQRRRRGIRTEVGLLPQGDEELLPQEVKVNMAARLEAAAQMLKRGQSVPQHESVKHAPAPENRYSHIKRFEGELENPFAAYQHDTQGLQGFVSFNEFDMSTLGGVAAAAAKSRKHSHKHVKKEKRGEKREHGGSKKHKRDDSRSAKKKHKGADGAASTAESLIQRYVGKVVESCKSSVPASALDADPKLLKGVMRKAAAKVFEDWASKPRGDLAMSQWLNDKRKAQIKGLVQKYLQKHTQSDAPPSSSNHRSSTIDLTQQPSPPPVAAAAAASSYPSSSPSFAPSASASQPSIRPYNDRPRDGPIDPRSRPRDGPVDPRDRPRDHGPVDPRRDGPQDPRHDRSRSRDGGPVDPRDRSSRDGPVDPRDHSRSRDGPVDPRDRDRHYSGPVDPRDRRSSSGPVDPRERDRERERDYERDRYSTGGPVDPRSRDRFVPPPSSSSSHYDERSRSYPSHHGNGR